jgi:hypothetical protein
MITTAMATATTTTTIFGGRSAIVETWASQAITAAVELGIAGPSLWATVGR